jgi:purine-cytosine permease-like protein
MLRFSWISILAFAVLGFLVALLGPRYAPELVPASSRPILLALIFVTCSLALFQRLRKGRGSS